MRLRQRQMMKSMQEVQQIRRLARTQGKETRVRRTVAARRGEWRKRQQGIRSQGTENESVVDMDSEKDEVVIEAEGHKGVTVNKGSKPADAEKGVLGSEIVQENEIEGGHSGSASDCDLTETDDDSHELDVLESFVC